MGASASHVHSNHNSHLSIHPHTNDAVNWIVTPFPEMGPQALYRLLEMRVEELWSQHYSMDDGHDRDAVKKQAGRLEDSLGACKLPRVYLVLQLTCLVLQLLFLCHARVEFFLKMVHIVLTLV